MDEENYRKIEIDRRQVREKGQSMLLNTFDWKVVYSSNSYEC